jgi:hypothetical protein
VSGYPSDREHAEARAAARRLDRHDPESAIAARNEGRTLDVESDTRGTPAERAHEREVYGDERGGPATSTLRTPRAMLLTRAPSADAELITVKAGTQWEREISREPCGCLIDQADGNRWLAWCVEHGPRVTS